MILKIRYENQWQEIVLDQDATRGLWLSLSIENPSLEDNEQSIQEEFNAQFNRPEYNSWHKLVRNAVAGEGALHESEESETAPEDETLNLEEICEEIRKAIKPDWAEAFIAVRLCGETVREYAARVGSDENNITQKLKRAERKLKKYFTESSDFAPRRG